MASVRAHGPCSGGNLMQSVQRPTAALLRVTTRAIGAAAWRAFRAHLWERLRAAVDMCGPVDAGVHPRLSPQPVAPPSAAAPAQSATWLQLRVTHSDQSCRRATLPSHHALMCCGDCRHQHLRSSTHQQGLMLDTAQVIRMLSCRLMLSAVAKQPRKQKHTRLGVYLLGSGRRG